MTSAGLVVLLDFSGAAELWGFPERFAPPLQERDAATQGF
jgi:hypothetical protein